MFDRFGSNTGIEIVVHHFTGRRGEFEEKCVKRLLKHLQAFVIKIRAINVHHNRHAQLILSRSHFSVILYDYNAKYCTIHILQV